MGRYPVGDFILPWSGRARLRRSACLLLHIGGCGYRGPVSGAPLFRTVRCCEPTQRIARTSPRQPDGEEVVSRKQSAVYKCSRGGSDGASRGLYREWRGLDVNPR